MTRQLRLLTSAAAPPPEAAAAALESDFVVILAALLCAVICVVGLLAVTRCAWLRRAAPNPHISGGAAANKGLKKKVLQNLPKFTFESSAPPPKMTSECAICLSEFVEGEEIRALPQCRHVFHVTCIDTWLTSHSSCPSCRQVLVVARCHKCGNFPAIPEAQPKTPPAVATSASATCSSNASNTNDSNCNSSDFLP